MEELHVTRQSKWTDFETVIQERFSSPVGECIGGDV